MLYRLHEHFSFIHSFITGSCYQYGRGADINMLKAIAHYDTSARMGYSKAQYHLGDLLSVYHRSYHINRHNKRAKYTLKAHYLSIFLCLCLYRRCSYPSNDHYTHNHQHHNISPYHFHKPFYPSTSSSLLLKRRILPTC